MTRPPAQSQPTELVGDDILELWTLRACAEHNVLASIAINPSNVYGVVTQCGINAQCFSIELHRAIFNIFARHSDRGFGRCARLAAAYWAAERWAPHTWADVFDDKYLFPTTPDAARERAIKLRGLVTLTREIENHYRVARSKILSAIELAKFGPIDTKQHRGPGVTAHGVKLSA